MAYRSPPRPSVLRHPAVTAVVVGAREATQDIEDVTDLTAAVSAELLAELGTGSADDD